MTKITRFDDIHIRQKAMMLCDGIYAITLMDAFSTDFARKDQIRNSAITVPAIIAKGIERESINLFIYFLTIAKASAIELRTQQKKVKNQKYASLIEFSKLKNLCNDVCKRLSGFITYLQERKEKSVNLSKP